jgi:hypothetical protein
MKSYAETSSTRAKSGSLRLATERTKGSNKGDSAISKVGAARTTRFVAFLVGFVCHRNSKVPALANRKRRRCNNLALDITDDNAYYQ